MGRILSHMFPRQAGIFQWKVSLNTRDMPASMSDNGKSWYNLCLYSSPFQLLLVGIHTVCIVDIYASCVVGYMWLYQ